MEIDPRLILKACAGRALILPAGNSARLKSKNMNNDKSYKLESTGGGKVSAALAKLCSQGELGEALLRSGVSQDAFCLFLARLAAQKLAAGKTPEQLADIFLLVSGGNASAARQALGRCELVFEALTKDGESILDDKGEPTWESKKQSVEAYWNKSSGGKAAPNLSLLD